MINYIFDEAKLLKEFQEYVDSTYSQHYASKGRIQVTEFIAGHCNSPDFFRGNSMKYLARYGHKEGYNRKDLMKAMHYLLMLLSWHDEKHKDQINEITVNNKGDSYATTNSGERVDWMDEVRDTSRPSWEYDPIPKEVFDPVKDLKTQLAYAQHYNKVLEQYIKDTRNSEENNAPST